MSKSLFSQRFFCLLVLATATSSLLPAAKEGFQSVMFKGESPFRLAKWSPDGRLVVAGSMDVNILNVESGKLSRLTNLDGAVRSINFSPDKSRCVVAGGVAEVWEIETPKRICFFAFHNMNINSATFSPNGSLVCTASDDGSARIIDAQTCRQLHSLRDATASKPAGGGWFLSGQAKVKSAHFSPDGNRIVTASQDKTARIWDVKTGQALHVLQHVAPVNVAKFSPDGRLIVTAADDGSVYIWNAETLEKKHLGGHRGRVNSVNFNPGARFIVTASDDMTARIWDLETGKELHALEGHTGPVHVANFSPDGRFIVTASDDKTARIWDVETGKVQHVLEGHTGPVHDANFSPNGSLIVTASADMTMRIWGKTDALSALIKVTAPPVKKPLTAEELALQEMSSFAQQIDTELRAQDITTTRVDPNAPQSYKNIWLEKMHNQELWLAPKKFVNLDECVMPFETIDKYLPNVVLLYKIHLMPQDKDFISLLIDLAEFAYRNKEFANLIYKVKCLPILESAPHARAMAIEKQWPKIVLYISTGKGDAQKALNMLYERYHAKEGLNRAPRFNQKVTSLIYFAQGNGDDKESYLEKYFEQPEKYYFKPDFTGKYEDYHLIHPGTGERL